MSRLDAGAATRLLDLNAGELGARLNAEGFTVIERLLSPSTCLGLRALYEQHDIFRKRIVMQQHGYGKGEYKYFAYPLPPLVQRLREVLYELLRPTANLWSEQLRRQPCFPATHAEFLERCHVAGQRRPTPLLLAYGEGDYNRLHQDVYGEHVFPLQLTVLLSAPEREFTGGEFVVTEQRPRMQSRPSVVPLSQGDAVVFAVGNRPAPGTRGFHRVQMRHGVSTVRSGRRHTLGVIFHDAQ